MKKHIVTANNKQNEYSTSRSKSSKKYNKSLTSSPKSTNSLSEYENKYDDNIFDLTKLVSMENEEQIHIEKNIINETDQTKLLKDYIEVDKNDWDKMPKNTHIRYLRNDGLFRKGGFVKNMWINSQGVNQGTKYIQLSSNITYKSQKWTVAINDINKIWKKNKSELLISNNNENLDEINKKINNIQNNIEKNNENIDYLLKMLDQLKLSVKNTQNDQHRVMNLVKQMHNKINR